jgi:hypothetical protein
MVRLRGFAATRFVMPRVRVFLPILVVLLAFLAVGAGSAAAKTTKSEQASKAQKASHAKCWQTLLNDWYPDGKINGTYPVHCYREAINHLPEDLKAYGEARNDIQRALLAFLASGDSGGSPPGPNAMVPGEESTNRNLESHQDKGFLQTIADTLGPGNATSIPLPLLILAGLGLLLVAAAAASFAARRIQARRLRPAPSPSPPRDHRK